MHAKGDMDNALLQATEALRAGRLRTASLVAVELVKRYPDDPRPLALMASVHLHADRPDLALTCLDRAAALAPSDAALQIRRGQCQARLGFRKEALASAAIAAALPLTTAALLDGLGTLYAHCDEPARALPLYERAVALAPDTSDYRYNLATAQRMVGQLVEAEASLDEVINARPEHGAAHLTRADLRRQTPLKNHVDVIRAQLAQPRNADPVPLWFALGKELEDLGDYPAAFDAWTQGARLQQRASRYNVQEDVRTLALLREHHTTERLRSEPAGHPSIAPVFVIGLPRSGTTLVESILGAHPEVCTPGEIPAFPNSCIASLNALGHRQLNKSEFVERSLEIPALELGGRYLDAALPQVSDKPRFVDKLPLNYLYAGLIHRALPRARIVLLMRDPRDSCLAMYKTLFTAAYPFSYDLADLADYYTAWTHLMAHWRTVLGNSLMTIRYEDLVTRTADVVRELLDHCQLESHPACLNFTGRKGQVATASAAQVRQPVYATSMGSWRHYQQELAPLIERLRNSGALDD